MTGMRSLAILLSVILLPTAAFAKDHALLFGHHRGHDGEAPLAHVSGDLERMHRTLRDVMDIADENIHIMTDREASSVETRLIQLNAEIRSGEGRDRLWVYYSGHGDAEGLHLGQSSLSFHKLKSLVKGSSAELRLLLIDACRSGGATGVKGERSKGFRVGHNFDVESFKGGATQSEGTVIISASSAGEDAQESDELSGSFFTHFWVSGLRGAADTNGDEQVTLVEAYRFAYDETLRSSSRTLAGTQHPTFDFDLKGKDEVILTRLGRHKSLSQASFPKDYQVLVFSGQNEKGALAEIPTNHKVRTLTLPAGNHQVQLRGRNEYLEGTINFREGESQVVEESQLERYQYAALVRKGKGPRRLSYAFTAGAFYQSPVFDGDSLCLGPNLAMVIDGKNLQVGASTRWCTTSSENQILKSQSHRFGFGLDLGYPFAYKKFTAAIGLSGRYDLLLQDFTPDTRAGARRASIFIVGPFVAASFDMTQRWFVEVRGRFNTNIHLKGDLDGEQAWRPNLSSGADLAAGFRW